MSATGKASRIPGQKSRLRKHFLTDIQLEALSRRSTLPQSEGPTRSSGSSAAGSTGGGTGNYLPTIGGGMVGNIAYGPKLITVDNGRVDLDPTNNNPKNSSYILVTGVGSPDDIHFIDGNERIGQYLIYQGTNQQIQIIKNLEVFSFTNIVGDGSTTVTVTLGDTGSLVNGNSINVSGTPGDTYDIVGGIVANLVVNTSFTYEIASPASTTPESVGQIFTGNIVTPDGKDIELDGTLSTLNVPIVTLIFDITIGGGGAWRVISVSTGGGAATSFPILYPQDDFGDQGAITLNVDISGNTGQNKKVRMTGDVGFQFTSPPGSTVLEEIWFTFEQDGTGGHSITTTPTGLKNANLLDTLLDKTANAKTTFHFITEDGGSTFRADLVDLTTGSGISFPIDFPEDDQGSPGATTTINFNDSDRHYVEITLTEDITVNFTNLSTTETELSTIRFIQNSSGGHTVTFNPALDNSVTIGDGSNEITDVFIKNSFGLLIGIIEGAKIFVGSNTADWANFPAVSDVDFATFDGINLDRLLFDQAAGESLASTSTGITSDGSGGMNLNVPNGAQYNFIVDGSITASMIITELLITAQSIIPVESSDTLGVGGIPWNSIFANNITVGGATNGINAIGELSFVNNTQTPAGNGIIYFDGTDLKAKTGSPSVVVNFSDIFVSPLITKGDLFTFDTDNARLPVGTDDEVLIADSAESLGIKWGQIQVSSIIDGNTSVTVNGTTDTATMTFDGDGNKIVIFGSGTARYENRGANYVSQYLRNDFTSGGSPGDFIDIVFHKGFNDAGPPVSQNYVTEVVTIKSPTDGAENGQYDMALLSKSSDKTAYTVEGGAGLINTNILHNIFGSMILKSDQTEEQSLFRMERNDSSTADDDTIGSTQFLAGDSLGNPTIYGSVGMEIADNTNDSEDGRFFVVLQNGLINQRAIEADMLTNTITLIPVANFEYLFSNLGFESRRVSNTGSEAADISLVKEDTNPGNNDGIGDIHWKGDDAGVVTEFAQMRGEIDVDPNSGKIIFGVRSNNASIVDAVEIIGESTFLGSTININARIDADLKFNLGSTVDFNEGQSTVGASGAASAPPAQPQTWITVKQSGTEYLVPGYLKP